MISPGDDALYCIYCRAHVSPPHRCESRVSPLEPSRDVYARVYDRGDSGNPVRSSIQRIPRTRRSFVYVID